MRPPFLFWCEVARRDLAKVLDRIAFLEDGWLPFATQCDSGCRVRMQRVGEWLIVQDNLECGSAGVSFTGLYRRTAP